MPLFHVTPRRMADDQVARVRDPATGQVVPEDGVTVEWSTYWERRLQDGDIDKVAAPADLDGESPTPAKDSRPRRQTSTTAPAALADNKD